MRCMLYGVLVVSAAGEPEPVCSQVVSRSAALSNRECQAWCEEGDSLLDEAFKAHCTSAHYKVVNGRTVMDNACFEKWVYGYAEPEGLAGVQTLKAETPAACQLICQETATCVNWVWSASVHSRHKECVLKSEVQIEKALGILTDSQPPSNLDVNYCNFQMGWTCQNLFNCLSCDERPRCVWESDLHVSGWKFCGNQNSCEPDLVFPPPAQSTPKPPAPTPQPPEQTTSEEEEKGETEPEKVENTTPQPTTPKPTNPTGLSLSQPIIQPPETTTRGHQPPVRPTQAQVTEEEDEEISSETTTTTTTTTTSTTTPQHPDKTEKTDEEVIATTEGVVTTTTPVSTSSPPPIQPPVVTRTPTETTAFSFPIQTALVPTTEALLTPSTPQPPHPLGRKLGAEANEPRMVLRFAKRPQDLQVQIEN
eukprot:Protomagalhaensia_wolfi_Nauph_80__461@NODE_1259_length_1627_cov_558_221033_g969_i0_p1_GENE_NODE_1259_length_1627_cov_558_221033_g969_i0NODE_1259_length_1627_cov_558_221033_g969_i0_p1_ORF_typecomplete_len421_score112_90PAN_4/PF14295_6/51PAN_4/PF14295_6/4e08PAN_4/PF14295_6/1_4e03PAN_1/PF00024_26/12PAN_1/PF00024_26/0_0012AspBHydro_N/PF05279_11/0_022_NODE_1259_length_1627_cov_558_221033_g969_i02781540